MSFDQKRVVDAIGHAKTDRADRPVTRVTINSITID